MSTVTESLSSTSCNWTGHSRSTVADDLAERIAQARSIVAALRHDLMHNRPTCSHVLASAEAHLERREQFIRKYVPFLEQIIMGTTTAKQWAQFQIGHGPATHGMIRALLLQHGWTWANATADASKALDDLIAQRVAEYLPDHRVYRLTTRQLPDKTPDGEKEESDA
jgi:hypothetical protein